MGKGVTPKLKKSTLTKKITPAVSKPAAKPKDTVGGGVKKVAKNKEKHDTWIKRLDELAAHQKREEIKKKQNPLSSLDMISEVLEKMEEPAKITKPAQQQPKRVTSLRGRKHALLNEQKQFRAVMHHPVFRANPFETIEKHLENSMKNQQQQQ